MEITNSDLVFNVAQLMKEPVGSTRRFNFQTHSLELNEERDGSEEDAQPLAARDVEGQVKVTRLTHDLLVQGDVNGLVELQCVRCLDRVAVAVDGTLEEKFQPTFDVETGRPVRREDYEEDDTAFSITANHEMDLTEPVRQSLLVQLPLKPLCRDDCKGLCPQCGANWNEGPCDCSTETLDNRWSALRDLELGDLPAGDSNVN